MLRGKKILLGVCGSIAAYKTALLIRLFIKEGAEVQVLTTPSALSFVSALTLSTLSHRPVYSEFMKNELGEWVNHVDLGNWADLMIIAPASANTLAKCANGFCDNLLTAVYLSARCPVIFAPSMDLDMYKHPATVANISRLKSYGNIVLEAAYGELASGLTGAGRMQEPEFILAYVEDYLSTGKLFAGKKILITAGPTYEAIDPVRFIGNRSSGKMGYALAEVFHAQGARVTLVSGPTSLPDPSGVDVIRVESAEEMYRTAITAFPISDIAVLAAAVADFKPANVHPEKLKKESAIPEILLEKTKDIAAELGAIKQAGQILIGFALETENEIENAKKKIRNKNFDLIVLNSLKDPGAGFSLDTNKISIIDKHNKIESFQLKSKKEVAKDIVNSIANYLR